MINKNNYELAVVVSVAVVPAVSARVSVRCAEAAVARCAASVSVRRCTTEAFVRVGWTRGREGYLCRQSHAIRSRS